MIKFTSHWGTINKVCASSETDTHVLINGRSEAKRTPVGGVFDTFEEARDDVLANARLSVSRAEERLRLAQVDLALKLELFTPIESM
jgi:hypothetical protein